jgi:hypothetical protein
MRPLTKEEIAAKDVSRRITSLLNLADDQSTSPHERDLAQVRADRLIQQHNVIHIASHPRYHWSRFRQAPHTTQGKPWRRIDDDILFDLWTHRVPIVNIANMVRRNESQCYARIRNLKKNGDYQRWMMYQQRNREEATS